MRGSIQVPLSFTPGVDKDAVKTTHWVDSNKIRFTPWPEKIGGNLEIVFDSNATISGVCRSIFNIVFSNRAQTVIGTHEKLYDLTGTALTNITPLETSTTAIANSLDTHYATLGNNPIATTSGSKTLTITDSEYSKFQAGDNVTLAGASTTNGVPNTEINATHVIRSIGTGNYTIRVSTAASSTGSGGGASVVRKSGLITAHATSHGQLDGDRVKLAGAATTGGVLNTEINAEHIIRNKTSDTFDVMTSGTATSSVTSGGGAGTTYQVEIDDGEENETYGQGYGAGLYGAGLYGTALLSSFGRVLPRIWYTDRFGEVIITTPGEGSGLYSWDGATDIAPALVTNAPTEINYAFVSDNIIVTFGDSGIGNRIKTSDQNGLTTWAGSSTNQVFEDDIEGAGRFLSHVHVSGLNLIFTENQTYSFRYIGSPLIWETKLIDPTVGIIAPLARIEVNGVAYWMGLKNFYMWRGGNIEIIPSNSRKWSTILDYVFSDINLSQKSKIFVRYNEQFQEIEFIYPSSGSNEPDRVARVNIQDFTWVPDTYEPDRTAADYPSIFSNPRMIDSEGILYQHEYGNDDNGDAMAWSLQGPKFDTGDRIKGEDGKAPVLVSAVIPDSDQTGNITLTIDAWKNYQSADKTFNQEYTVSATTERVATRIKGRVRQYMFEGEAIGQNFKMGEWVEEIKALGGSQ